MKYNTMTDEQLITELRNGETGVTDYLLEKYKGHVKRKARTMYLWGGETEDLIQEGMIGLFKAVQDFSAEEGASFFSFAELCISRQIYSAVKAAQRKKHIPLNSYVSLYTESDVGEEGNTLPLMEMIEAGTSSDPEELVLGTEYVNNFETELNERLSKLEKRVLCLHLMGMDYLSIADVMEKSPKTVDNALQRIKNKVKNMLQEKSKAVV